MATSGRGEYHSCIYVWRWSPTRMAARAIVNRLPPGMTPTWLVVVPPGEPRPEWILEEYGALAFALADDDTAYVW